MLAAWNLLFHRPLATRCPHNTERAGLSLSPERVLPPPGGSCRSTHLSSFLLLWASTERPTVDDLLSLVAVKRTSNCGFKQTHVPLHFFCAAFSEACFISFPGNGSPEVSLRTVRVWSQRGTTRQGDASNGEKPESTRLNPKSSTRYLTLVD